MKQNGQDSPLLRLPPELRDKIWREVLGDRLIHLEYKYFDYDLDFDDHDDVYRMTFHESPWRHIVCEDDGPENSPKRKHLPNPRYYFLAPGAENRLPWSVPHDDCRLDYELPKSSGPVEYHEHEGMRLTVLRASRQIRTTGFSPLPVVKSLIGLRSLRLNILYEMLETLWLEVKDRFLGMTRYTECLRKLSTLPLTYVDVNFRIAEHRGTPGLWQKAQREQCAEELKSMLLNPEGAEVYAERQRELKESSRINREMEERRRMDRHPFPVSN
ncbi:MAG: hypothetical protein Q9186_006637 [Xanthomendoza sp. 1 TL-2023]